MNFGFRPAQRSNAKPLIGIYSVSGAGKTFSALLLARGFVGRQGVIGMIETESGRGEAYCDIPEIGGYQVLSLRDDFSPENYGKAISAAEKAGLNALIIDSASHEWEGVGGVLDMAAKNQESGKKGPLVWQKPKIDHQKHFMLRLLQTPIDLVIVCMRAKYPMEEVIKDGRKSWQRSESLSPKQSEDILFEMFAHGWISQDHRWHWSKWSHPTLEPIIGENQPISIATGERLAKWAHGKSESGSSKKQADESMRERALKACIDAGHTRDGIEAHIGKPFAEWTLDDLKGLRKWLNEQQWKDVGPPPMEREPGQDE